MKKILVVLVLLVTGLTGFYFFQNSSGPVDRVAEAALEDDIVVQYKLFQKLDADFPKQSLLKSQDLYRITFPASLAGISRTDSMTYYGNEYYDERNKYDGNEYCAAVMIYEKPTQVVTRSGDQGEAYNFQRIELKTNDLGFIPLWRRQFEYSVYKKALETELTDEEIEVAEKVKPVVWELPVNKEEHIVINDHLWYIKRKEHPDWSPDPWIAYTFLGERFEVSVYGMGFQDLEDFRRVIQDIKIDDGWVSQIKGK